MTSPMNGKSIHIDSNDHEPKPGLDECIYRVPSKLRNVNKASYTPQLLSIGPFHHGSPELKDMESQKQKYHYNFLRRCSKNPDELKKLVEQNQKRLLSCYAGTIECGDNFANVILVDACFIVELFITDSETENHQILRSPWMRKAIETDLILFENQIPFYFLEVLYDFAISGRDSETAVHSGPDEPVQHHHQFLSLACKFFEGYNKKKRAGGNPKHFTDLVRHFVCTDKVTEECKATQKKCKFDVRKLKAAGVKFTHLAEPFVIEPLSEAVSSWGSKLACLTTKELKLTRFWATYDAESVIRNIMALEQLIYPEKAYICSYFLLLSQLVNTVEDVDMLIKDGVVENLLGSNKSVEKLINSFCVHIAEEISCYSDIYDQLKQYETSLGNRRMATLKHVYFKDLWTGSATILGLVVLVFSIIGTINSLTSHDCASYVKK